ncbi:tripartite motif-containing protein 2-like [Ptychodera flava]|uniref:tripartite motif-containing protein 2-like n=1 Tax=Ptychodera flava TaxID=63121 RepID=UPI00396AA279
MNYQLENDRTILENRLVDAQQEINVLRELCRTLMQKRQIEEKVAEKLSIQSLNDKDEKAEQKTAKQEDESKTTMSTQQRDAGIAGPSKSELSEEGQREKGQSSQSSIVEPLRIEIQEGTMKEPTHTDIKRKLPIGQKDGKAMADQSKRPKMPKESKRAIPEWKPMTRRELLTMKRPATFATPEYRLSRRLPGPQNGQPFKYPKGLAFIGNRLAVCNSDNNMVQIINQDDMCESVLGTFDGQFPKPFRPINVAVSKHKHYFIIDDGNLQIVVCDETKTIIKLIDLRLLGADSPTGIALQNGFILVTDQKVSKLMKLTRDGKCVGQYKEGFPHSVAVNSNDVILVTDNATSRIKCFDSSLNLLHQYCTPGNDNGQLLYPRGIDVDEQNNVFICDWNNHRAVKFKPGGEWQCTLFQIRCPEYIAVADDGRVAVAGETHCIEIYVPSE